MPVVKVSCEGGDICVAAPFSPTNLERCRKLPGGAWDSKREAWRLPANQANALRVTELFSTVHFEPDEAFTQLLPPPPVPRNGELCFADIPHARTQPWRHQRAAYWFAKQRDATMLNMGMGTGKSKVVVDLVCGESAPSRVLVLSPLSVVPVWPRQFELHAGREVECKALEKGSVKDRVAQAVWAFDHHPDKRVVIALNYEAARQGFSQNTRRKQHQSMARYLLEQEWDMVVLDESHRIKTGTSAISRFCAALRGRAKKRLCLTGTMLPNSPLDAWAQVRFLDNSIFDWSFTRFKQRYAIMGGFRDQSGRPHEILGYQNQHEFVEKLSSVTYQARSEDVLDLPEGTFVERYYRLSAEEGRVYRKLEKEFVAEVENGTIVAANALARLLRLAQVCSGFSCTDDGEEVLLGNSKRSVLKDTIEDIGWTEPVVVFCRFHRDLEAVHEVGEELGRQVREVSGRKNELGGSVWKEGNGNILAVQIQAGALGLDFTRSAYSIYYGLDFNLANYLQSLARLMRPGQERPVTNIHLLGRDTVEEKTYAALEAKEQVVESVLRKLTK